MQKKQFGLLGFPLSHSFSKKYFEEKFMRENISDCNYVNYEFSKIEDVKQLFQNPDLIGFNITIPYKKLIIPFLTRIDTLAENVGAVNCVKHKGNEWIGFNTDVYGFENSLKPLLTKSMIKALVLGTGGAAHAICFVLERFGIEVTKVSSQEKDEAISYYDVDEDVITKHLLIINTTPLGAFPNEDKSPDIPYESLNSGHLCYDLTYNPGETLFLKRSKEHNAKIKNGYEMLVLQAEESWRIWNEN